MIFKRRIHDASAGPTTYIAPSTKIVGTIAGQGSYVFCGIVEGDCDINGPLTLAEGGSWKGILKATDIIVAGTVEGDVVARQRVEISGTARVSGSLSGNSIKVTSGEPPVKFQEKRQP
jgi:cytoskeletal protein CcmA (bactofilin family)